MSSPYTLSFNALPLAANYAGPISTVEVRLGGFLCTTAGTIQVRSGPEVTSDIAVAAFPVTVGQYYELPFSFGSGAYVELTAGAAGTLAYI